MVDIARLQVNAITTTVMPKKIYGVVYRAYKISYIDIVLNEMLYHQLRGMSKALQFKARFLTLFRFKLDSIVVFRR